MKPLTSVLIFVACAILGAAVVHMLVGCGGAEFTAGPSQDDAGQGIDAPSVLDVPATPDGPWDSSAPSPDSARLIDEGAPPGTALDAGDAGDAHKAADADARAADADAGAPDGSCLPGFECLSGSGPVSCPPSYLPCSRSGEVCNVGEVCCERCP